MSYKPYHSNHPAQRTVPTHKPPCPHCGNDDQTMIARVPCQIPTYFCDVCAKEYVGKKEKNDGR